MSKSKDPTFAHRLPDLIDEGEYSWQCLSYQEKVSDFGKKLYLHGKIVSESPFHGTELFMVINRAENKIGINSKMFQSWLIANHMMRPKRKDRMSYRIFRGGVFRVKVKTVSNKKKSKSLLPYSIVECMVVRET